MGNDARVAATPVACTLSQPDLKQRAERWHALVRHVGRQVLRTDRRPEADLQRRTRGRCRA